jgi:5-methylcytosine-specific restriction endonuclease McrA
VLSKLDKAREKVRQYRQAHEFVRRRDKGRCRVCGGYGTQAHHVVYRSHGGRDEPRNLVWCCASCHRLIHAKVVLVTFDPKHPAKSVKFTRNTEWDAA